MIDILPNIGEQWIHHNGRVYEVVLIANVDSVNEHYPITVIYKGQNGRIWSKQLDNFLSKMKKIM
jgi:hypothetical protein